MKSISKNEHYEINCEKTSGLDDRKQKILKILKNLPIKDRKLLDVGCGDGDFSILMKDALVCQDVSGVEMSNEGCKQSSQKGIKSYQLDVDSKNLPFEDEYFDVIFCGEVIEHLFDTDHLLDELYRVVKKDGFVIMTTPNLSSWYNRIALFFGYQPFWTSVSLRHNLNGMYNNNSCGYGGHIRVFCYRTFEKLLSIHKFKIEYSKGAHFQSAFPFPLSLIEKHICIFPSLSSNMIFILRK